MTAREFAQLQGELGEYDARLSEQADYDDATKLAEPDLCQAVIYRATVYGPEELCCEPVEVGSKTCGLHPQHTRDEYSEED